MTAEFKFNADIGFTSSGLDKVLSDAKKGLSSLKGANLPINLTTKGGTPFNSSAVAKAVNLKGITDKLDIVNKKTKDVTSEFEKFGQTAAATVKRFGAFVIVANAFNSVSNAIQTSFAKAIEFEKQINKISQVTGTAYRDLGGLTAEISRLSIGLGVSSEKLANVALTLAQAGISAKDTKKALEVLAKTELSATFENINNTGEASIAIMAQFGTSVDDLSKQLSSINSISAKFAVESSDLATVIRRAGGAFQATGGDLEELLALFTSVRATTRESAESISTGLRTIFTRLQRTRTVNFLSELGIDLKDSKGQFIGVYQSIAVLSKALRDIKGSDPRFSQIVEELGGFRQVSKVIPLLKQFEMSEKALAVSRRANNSLDRDAIIAQQTLANKIQKTKEEFDALIRSYSESTFLKEATVFALGLASALIKVGDAIRPLIPAITLLSGVGFLKSINPISKGIASVFNPIRKKEGGIVPGSGNGDIVPAMLEPGEFVLKKSAVQAFGAHNLGKINRYAGGGVVDGLKSLFRLNKSNSKIFRKVGINGISDKIKIKKILQDYQRQTGVDPSSLVNSINIKRGGAADSSSFGEFSSRRRSIDLNADSIKNSSKRTIRGVAYHELSHGLDFQNGKYNSEQVGTKENILSDIYKKTKIEKRQRLLSSGKISQSYFDYRNAPKELFADFTSDYLRGKTKLVGKEKENIDGLFSEIFKERNSTSKGIDYVTGLHRKHIFTNTRLKPKNTGILGKLKSLFKSSKEKESSTVNRYDDYFGVQKLAFGGIAKAIRKSSRQGLGSLLAGHQNLGPAPKIGDQLKDLLAPGGFLRSLGVGRKNWLMGDKGYTSVDNSPLVYQMTTRPYNRLLPPKQVIPPFPKQTGGPFVRFKTPGFVHPEGAVFPSPNSSPLPYVKPPIEVTNVNTGRATRRFRKIESDYMGSAKSVGDKLRLKSSLLEFQKITGINPAGLISSARVVAKSDLPDAQKSYAGAYFPKSGRINITPDNIKKTNYNPSSRSVRGVLYHELAHAIDNGSFGKQFHSVVSDKSNQAKLAQIYKAINIKQRTKDLSSGRMSQKQFNYLGGNEEEFANFFSAYFRGKLKVPKGQQKKVQELVQSLLYAARGQTRREVEKSGRTLNDVLGLKKTIRKRYAGGGTVGGSGDTDTVPALLTPGEVVINKKSAQAFGYDKLHKINRYAKGGVVNKTNLAFAAATLGPSLAETAITTYSSEAGSAIKPFVGAITVASAALLTFAFGLRENTADAEDSFKQYSEVLDKSSTRMTALEAQASKLKSTISAGTTPLFNTNGTGVPTPVLDAKGKQAFSKTLEAQKAEAKLTQNIIARNRLNPILAETRGKTSSLKSEIDTDKTFNKRALIGAIGAAVFAAAGSAVEGYAQRDAALGNKKSLAGIDTTTLSTLGGTAQGAANGLIAAGALSQMVGNPYAKAAILAGGTIAGGVAGGYTAGSTSAATLRQFESQKEIDSLLSSLAKVSSGRSTFTDQNPQILSGVDYINKQFTTLSKDELPAFAAQLESALNGLDSLFNAGTESAKSLEEFKTRNEKLILAMSRFGGETIPQLEERAKNLIETQLKQNKAIEEATINAERLQAIFNISSAIEDAGRSISKLSSSLSTLEDIISGQFGPSLSNLDFSALSNIGGSRISDVSEQANRAGSLIGGPAVQLGQDVTAAAQLSSKIPSILNEVINGNQLEEGDITDKLRAKFGKGFGADIFIEAINKEIGQTANSVELIKKFKQDPVGVAKTIQAAIDPMVNALSDATPKIIDQFDQFASGLASGRANFIASIDRFVKGIDIEQIGAELNANARGTTLSFAENQSFDARKLSSIAGPNNSVAQLNSRLISANENIRGLETQQSEAKTPEEFKALTAALEENKREAEVVHKSLEYLADVNNRLATTQKELQRLQSERQNKAALAKSFAFGSPAEQRDILKGLMGVKTILANEKSGNAPLANLSLESRKLALSIFEQYAEDKVFNGKTGREKINSIAGAPFGIDFNKPTTAEENILNIQNSIVKNATDANSVLYANLTSSNDKFIEGLGLRFDKFFVELRKSFGERADAERKTKEEEKNAEIANVGGKIDFLKFIQKATGRNVNDVNTVGAIRSNIAPLEKAKRLKEESESLAAASKKFINGGFKGGTYELEAILGKQFTRDFSGLKTPEQKRAFVEKESAAGIDKRFQERNKIFTEVNTALPGAVGGIYNNLKQLKEGLEKINDGETVKELAEKRKKLEGKANGGVIGLATGGRVRGTDTVPAMTTDGKPYMLTPGEYVMKRSAVQKYGIGFMKKVNMGYLADGGRVSEFRNGRNPKIVPYGYLGPKSEFMNGRPQVKSNYKSEFRNGASPKLSTGGNNKEFFNGKNPRMSTGGDNPEFNNGNPNAKNNFPSEFNNGLRPRMSTGGNNPEFNNGKNPRIVPFGSLGPNSEFNNGKNPRVVPYTTQLGSLAPLSEFRNEKKPTVAPYKKPVEVPKSVSLPKVTDVPKIAEPDFNAFYGKRAEPIIDDVQVSGNFYGEKPGPTSAGISVAQAEFNKGQEAFNSRYKKDTSVQAEFDKEQEIFNSRYRKNTVNSKTSIQEEFDKEQEKLNSRYRKEPAAKPFRSLTDVTNQVEKTWTPKPSFFGDLNPLTKNANRLAGNNANTSIPVIPRRDTSFVDMMSAKRLEGERVKKNRNNISFGDNKFKPDYIALKRSKYQGAVKDNIAFGMSPEDAKRKALGEFSQDGNQRDRFQREKNDLIRGGMSPKEASRKLLAEYKNDKDRFAPPKTSGSGGGFFSVPPEKMSPMDRKNEEAYQKYNPLEQGIIKGAEEQGTPQWNKLRNTLSGHGYIAGENGYENPKYPGRQFHAEDALEHIKANRPTQTQFVDKMSAQRQELERVQGNRNNLRLDDRRKIDIDRADFQKKRGELIRGGMSPREASQQLLHPSPAPVLNNAVQGKAPVGLNNPVQEKQAQQAQPAQMLNPQLMQEFNAAVNKLAGTKLEIVLNGTLDIRIIEGTLGDSLRDKFKEAAREYVDVKVTEAINTLAKDNGLAQVPKGINKGAQPK